MFLMFQLKMGRKRWFKSEVLFLRIYKYRG